MSEETSAPEPERKTYWVTRYWETKGIQEVKGYRSEAYPTMLVAQAPPSFSGCQTYFHEPYFHPSLKAAREHMALLARRKEASLQKALKRVQKILAGAPTATATSFPPK